MEKEFIVLNQEKFLLHEYYSFKAINSQKVNHNRRLFSGKSFCIAISPDTNRLDGYLPNPYFKLGNADNLESSTGIIRINFRIPGIEEHTNFPQIKITKRVLDDLNYAIRYRYNFRGKILSVLEILNIGVKDFIKGRGYDYKDVKEYPDFTVLEGYINPTNAVDIY